MFKKRTTVASIMAPLTTAITQLGDVSENRKGLAAAAEEQVATLQEQAQADCPELRRRVHRRLSWRHC